MFFTSLRNADLINFQLVCVFVFEYFLFVFSHCPGFVVAIIYCICNGRWHIRDHALMKSYFCAVFCVKGFKSCILIVKLNNIIIRISS